MSCSRSGRPPPAGGVRASPARRGCSPASRASPAAAFGPGMVFDVLPGCAQLAVAADAAAGDDRFAGVSEAELVGLMCAWDRVEAHAAARKLAVIAELDRRNPGPEDAEFTADQVACALGESRFRADELTGTAGHLDTHLPGTGAALRDGIVSLGKARIIAAATGLLDPAEARAAEPEVLDRAGRLTPGSLRAAIARAVMEAAPGKARKRRETAARFARVERWAEDSGNAALAGRELPPDQVLAADERITAGRGNCQGRAGGRHGRAARPGLPGPAPGPGLPPRGSPPGVPGAAPAGFASRVTLTAPLATLTRLAGRPGELSGLGPVDPWLTRDLAAAAARNPKTTWCVTVTDQPGPRHRARLRPARTQEPPQTRRPRPAGVLLHPGQPGRPARERIWHLAAAHPRTRAGPDHHPRPGHHRPLRPPPPGQAATTPGSGCGTCPRSGTPPAPAPSAGAPPPSATTSTTSPTKRAAAPVCATPARSAGTTTASSSTPSGRSTSFPTAPSDGPHRRAGPTPPNPPATPSERHRRASSPQIA